MLLFLKCVASCLLVFVFLPIIVTPDEPGHDKRVVCYLASWGVYLNGRGKFEVEDAEPGVSMCTHVVYNFLLLDEESNKIRSNDPFTDFTDKETRRIGGLEKLAKLKRNHPHLKVMIGVGGWNDGSIKYSRMSSLKARRRNFTQSAVDFLKTHKLDGLDLNWQFPGDRGGSPADKSNLVLLIKEMREEFDKHGFIISSIVSCFPYRISLGVDPLNLATHAHFLNILTYEYHGFWEEKVGHGAPLRSKDELSVEATINRYLEQGVPPEKINLGISNYGMTFFLLDSAINNTENLSGLRAKNHGFKGPYHATDGFIGYNEVCLDLKDSSWRIVFDPEAFQKFAVKGDKVISFDDTETIKEKVKFAMTKKLGGIIYYSLEKDDFRPDCGPENYPILRAIDSSIKENNKIVYDDLLALLKIKNSIYFWTLGDNVVKQKISFSVSKSKG